MDIIEIKEYKTSDGRNPFQQWFNSLKDIRAQTRIDARIKRIRQGNFGSTRFVGEGVNEIKIDYGPGYRVYYGKDTERMILLLGGGSKKRQSSDIDEAKQCWKDHQKRKDDATLR